MAALTVYARASDPVLVSADALGDTFLNNGDTEILIVNAGVSAVDVTFSATHQCSHGFTDDWVVSCDGQELTRIGPFEARRFNTAQGLVAVTYADETNLTVAAQRLR